MTKTSDMTSRARGIIDEHDGISKGDLVTINPPFEDQFTGKALGWEFGDWAIEFENPLKNPYIHGTTAKRTGGREGHCHWIPAHRVSRLEIIGDDDDDCV